MEETKDLAYKTLFGIPVKLIEGPVDDHVIELGSFDYYKNYPVIILKGKKDVQD